MDERARGSAPAAALMVFDSVLDAGLRIRQLHLNAAFVELTTALYREARGAPLFGLSPSLLERLCRLAPPARGEVAASPFAIYGLRLHDTAYWQVVRDGGRSAQYARLAFRPSPDTRERLVRFATMALHHAAGLAASNEYGAGLLFGVPLGNLRLLASIPLPALSEAAVSSHGLLCARLHDHPRVWPYLLDAVESGQRERCFAAKSMAFQALAAASAAGSGLGADQTAPD